jgi:hypothetical protein
VQAAYHHRHVVAEESLETGNASRALSERDRLQSSAATSRERLRRNEAECLAIEIEWPIEEDG